MESVENAVNLVASAVYMLLLGFENIPISKHQILV